MKADDKSIRMHHICGVVARIGLILSLWQAPVPWLHCHGTDLVAGISSQTAGELMTHLDSFHRPYEINSDEEFGWHCHWIIPSWFHDSNETPDEHQSPSDSAGFDSVIPMMAPTHIQACELSAELPRPTSSPDFAICTSSGLMAPRQIHPPLSVHSRTRLRC